MRYCLLLSLLLCLSGTGRAQTIQPGTTQSGTSDMARMRQWYDRETIYLMGPNRYVKNNVMYGGHQQLKREFVISEGGMQLYLRSRRMRNIATVISLAGSAGSIYSLVTGNRNNVRTFFWISLGTGLVSSTLSMQANSQLGQAVWLRNRDALILLEQQR
ncbi:hypothetical protein [Telluribacter sp. SYSU D00476]|uniref:hypothetical protein n=1 Tax=Telluribacter sp. SYSU D00476 TaxID=2811430 RepID=UPI001FF26D4C|nr:hypothetical protein [Telluribacter sp. SYSU D00476]